MPKCLCRNVHITLQGAKNIHVLKCSGAEMFRCRKFLLLKIPMPKIPHVETFQCWKVHLPERPQRRTVLVPKCSCDETSVPKWLLPKWLLPKCSVPKWSIGVSNYKLLRLAAASCNLKFNFFSFFELYWGNFYINKEKTEVWIPMYWVTWFSGQRLICVLSFKNRLPYFPN